MIFWFNTNPRNIWHWYDIHDHGLQCSDKANQRDNKTRSVQTISRLFARRRQEKDTMLALLSIICFCSLVRCFCYSDIWLFKQALWSDVNKVPTRSVWDIKVWFSAIRCHYVIKIPVRMFRIWIFFYIFM